MKNEEKNCYSVLFVGHLYPKHLESVILDQPLSPIQTQRFGEALMLALIEGFGDAVQGFSVASLLDYPKCKLLIAPRAKWYFSESNQVSMFPYINILGLKHLTRFLATFFFALNWAMHNRHSKRVIVMHGVQSCKIWGVLLASVFTPALTISFLTDDLGIPLKWEGAFSRAIRRIDVFLMKLGLQRVSGVIAMTAQLADKLAPGRPRIIIPAIYNPSASSQSKTYKRDSVFTIGYFGGLYSQYGLDLLLDAFEMVRRDDWRLLIAGKGEMEKQICELALRDHRIKFLGFLSPEEVKRTYQIVDVLINPRPTSIPIASLSFPSKLVEYLSTGKPVITTDLPVLDENFRRHLIVARSDTPEELVHCLEQVATWEDERYESWRVKTLAFVENELSPRVQGKKIEHFIDSLFGKYQYS